VDFRGHCGYKADNGHLYITVSVQEDNRFRVDGNNVHCDLDLDFVTAACGGSVTIDTVHGPKEVAIEAGTQSGSELRIFNAGLKSPFSKRMGDQVPQ
jgi:molecular chaperone DnaJ